MRSRSVIVVRLQMSALPRAKTRVRSWMQLLPGQSWTLSKTTSETIIDLVP